MATGLIYSDRFLDHNTGSGHPERADRLRAIVRRLKEDGLWDRLDHLKFEPADRARLERLHTGEYIDRVFEACRSGQRYLDVLDCAISADSADVAQLAVGGALAAVDAVMAGRVSNAFCALRPPGHHAEADRAMGFCYFANVALAADYLTDVHSLQRVAVVDFDVHHGNGTQHLLEQRADVLVISLHEHPRYLYPGTGYEHERGRGDGEGYTLNIPLMPHAGDEQYREAFERQVLPALRDYGPQFLLLSAGFDAAEQDPLAHMQVTPGGFEWITRALCEFARQACDGRVVSCLEGGYHLEQLAESVARHAAVLETDG